MSMKQFLYWKRMFDHTYIVKEMPVPGFKDANYRLTLLLGGNTSCDFSLNCFCIIQKTKGSQNRHFCHLEVQPPKHL